MQSFDSALFFCLYISSIMNVITLESTESTNRDAMELASQGAMHGTAVIAKEQSQGRGRLGKRWQSPQDKGLYCSIIVRPDVRAEDYPFLTFVAGLAVAEALEKEFSLKAGLKWPNDIFFGMRKCGGILTESSNLHEIAATNRFAVVGIGLNVNTALDDFDEEIAATATSLLIESGKEIDLKMVFDLIRNELLIQIELFENEGFLQVIRRWRKRDCLLGKRLSWVSVTGCKVFGVSLGPDDEGRLHVKDDNGIVHEILSGDIQLARN